MIIRVATRLSRAPAAENAEELYRKHHFVVSLSATNCT